MTALLASTLQQIAAGDRSALAACLDLYGGMVWSLARRFLGDGDDVDDAVQEIFLEIWQRAARFDPRVASEATFVGMIARRRLIDRRRRLARQPRRMSLTLEQDVALAGEQLRVERDDEVARVRGALQSLRPEQREVIELAVEGLTYPEIATRLDLPLGTVKTHARRGLLAVRDVLGVRSAAIAGATNP